MADPKRALVLHVANAGEPLVFAVPENDLEERLTKLLASGQVHGIELADGSTVSINFKLVATAHLDVLPPLARVYGSGQPQKHGFAT
jgi:hypothetical protein